MDTNLTVADFIKGAAPGTWSADPGGSWVYTIVTPPDPLSKRQTEVKLLFEAATDRLYGYGRIGSVAYLHRVLVDGQEHDNTEAFYLVYRGILMEAAQLKQTQIK